MTGALGSVGRTAVFATKARFTLAQIREAQLFAAQGANGKVLVLVSSDA